MRYYYFITALLLVTSFLLFSGLLEADGAETLTVVEASFGLPQDTDSFSTVEVFDSDGNGKDEIYLGGAGFVEGTALTDGIRAYEYDTDAGKWEPFGSGLPGEGSGVNYGGLGLGDVNNDGEMDIVGPVPSRWYEYQENGLDIYTGDGNGNFQFLHKVRLVDEWPGSSNEVEVYDLDNDGFNDLVASTYSGIKVFFGDGSGTRWLESGPSNLNNMETSGIGVGDLNGDGLLDIVGTPGQGSSEVKVYIQGNLRSWREVNFKDTDAGYGVKVIDLDLDGNDDIVYGTRTEGIKVWLGEGTVTLTSIPTTEASSGLPDSDGDWDQIEFADINGDDKPDMIAAINSRSTVHCFINDLPDGWNEIFTGSEELYVGGDAYGANFGDWDGDGQLDIAACSWDHGADAWLIPKGGGTSPIADAGRDRTVDMGGAVILDGSGSRDPDGTIVEWEWTCTSHDLVLTDPDSSSPSFIPDEEGTFVFNLRVMDDDDEWSQVSSVRITVIDPNKNNPPVADAGNPIHNAYVGDLVELDGSSSSDIDGTIVEWKWTCTSHSIDIEDDDTAYASFISEEDGDHILKLTVTDDDGDSSSDQITVNVDYRRFSPKIGPIAYDDGGPVPDAVVSLSGNGIERTALTDANGFAQFPVEIIAGTYTCSVTLDGVELMEPFTVTITNTGSVQYIDGKVPSIPIDEETDNSLMIFIVVGAVAFIVVAGIVMVVVNRKRADNTAYVEEVRTVQTYNCETCNSRLEYNPDFNMYFCHTCQKYAGQ